MVSLPSAKVTHLPKEAPPTYQTKLNRDGSCGLRRRASYQRRPPAWRRLGRAARPRRSGGRQLTLYLKVATICPSPGGEWSGAAGCCDGHLVAPPNFGQDAPGRICGQATAQKHQGPLTLGVLRALALLPRERLVPAAVSEIQV